MTIILTSLQLILDGQYKHISYTSDLWGRIGSSSLSWLGDTNLRGTCTRSLQSLLTVSLNLLTRVSMETYFQVETRPTLIKCIFTTLIVNVVFDFFFFPLFFVWYLLDQLWWIKKFDQWFDIYLAFCVCWGAVYVMRCAIWYHLSNLKNRENTHGEVLLSTLL